MADILGPARFSKPSSPVHFSEYAIETVFEDRDPHFGFLLLPIIEEGKSGVASAALFTGVEAGKTQIEIPGLKLPNCRRSAESCTVYFGHGKPKW